jgi:LysR family transcriptional regulator, hypochlorite-specific transcription factor HypT
VDRSAQPVNLTPAGHNFRPVATQMVKQAEDARRLYRAKDSTRAQQVKFAVAHSLMLSFFPNWYGHITEWLTPENASANVSACNILEGAQALKDAEADLLLTYYHPKLPIFPDPERYEFLVLGTDMLRPYSIVDQGQARYSLASQASLLNDPKTPYLAYSANTFLGHVVDMILLNSASSPLQHPRFQTQMSEGIKAMVLAGHGIAWLPQSCVVHEVEQKRIVAVGDSGLSAELEIRLFRSHEDRNALVSLLWERLHRKAPNVTF